MKNKIFLVLLLVICTRSGLKAQPYQQARYKKKKRTITVAMPPRIFASVSREAEFPGGAEALKKHLSANIRYPAAAREDGIQGTVTVRFLLEADGSVSHASVIKDIGSGCGRETLRVLKAMPAWKPYQYNGRNIPSVVMLAVRFQLP